MATEGGHLFSRSGSYLAIGVALAYIREHLKRDTTKIILYVPVLGGGILGKREPLEGPDHPARTSRLNLW